MFFIGIITDKNSENNIKNIMKNKLDNNQIIFLNKDNIENFKNVRFDSVVINNRVEDRYVLDKITGKSRFVLYNSDITNEYMQINESDYKKDRGYNLISYGYNSRANVTVSSVGDDEFLLYVQENIPGYDMQEIKFNKAKMNVNAYDGMITTIINLIYNNG
ncbi:MAG: hypothetical protein IKE91_02135 [Clostridia bacterium]|nr:hypothetical protein [Clostridia bacterium]